MKLSLLYSYIKQFEPDLVNPEIEDYCDVADEIQTDKAYNFGYMSLKWAMYQISAIDPRRAKHVFKAILIEHKARTKTIDDLQFNILKYAAVNEYRAKIRENTKDRVNLEDLPVFSAGDYNIVINQTGLNLTAKIMRETNADAIIFIEHDLGKSGIQFRVNSSMNQLEGFKQYFMDQVSQIEAGWMFIGETKNLIINHGSVNKTPSILSIEILQNIVLEYFHLIHS